MRPSAIAGVANFITKRDFAGVELASTVGMTERGDGARYRFDVTVGANFDDGRGNAVLNVGYQKVEPVLQRSAERVAAEIAEVAAGRCEARAVERDDVIGVYIRHHLVRRANDVRATETRAVVAARTAGDAR